MNEDFISKNRTLLYTSFVIITIITFYPLFTTGFGCADDLQNYFVARWGKSFENAKSVAGIAGRFYYLFVCPVYSLPFMIDNMFFTKIFQVIPIIVCYVLFARILFIITRSKELAFLYFLLVNVLMQVSGHTSLFVNYPFYYTFSFALLLSSYLLLLSFLKKRKKKLLFYSAILYISGLLFYEIYLFSLVIIAFTIFFYYFRENDALRQKVRVSILHFLPYLGLTILYLAIYFIYRVYHPSNYDGTTLAAGGVTLQSFFTVLWNFSYTSFPLTVFDSSRELFDEKSGMIPGHSPVVSHIIMNARVEWLIKGILAAWCTFLILMRLPEVKIKTFAGVILLSALLIFMPHVPLALTSKYTFYASVGMIGYITTWYSFFGVVLLVTFLFAFLIHLFDRFAYLKKAVALILVFFIFICSVLTDYSNNAVEKDIRAANLRFHAVDEMVRSEPFRSIPEGSYIFARDLYKNPFHMANNLTDQSFDWSYYLGIKSGINHQVVKNENDYARCLEDTARQSYYLTMRQALKDEDVAIVIARIMPPALKDSLVSTIVNEAWVFYYSKYKIFSVSFDAKEPVLPGKMPMMINHIKDTIQTGKNLEFTIYNTQRYRAATIFSIKADSVDLKSIRISNMVNPGRIIFYL